MLKLRQGAQIDQISWRLLERRSLEKRESTEAEFSSAKRLKMSDKSTTDLHALVVDDDVATSITDQADVIKPNSWSTLAVTNLTPLSKNIANKRAQSATNSTSKCYAHIENVQDYFEKSILENIFQVNNLCRAICHQKMRALTEKVNGDSHGSALNTDGKSTFDPLSLQLLQSSCAPFSREIFCSVPGRLSLLCSSTKYNVTVAELERRISPPEALNASLLGGILRRAKSKNGGKTLRDQLGAIGLRLPVGRRKSTRITLFTSMVEGEAMHLAKEFSSLCASEFPSKLIAKWDHKKLGETATLMKLIYEKEKFTIAKKSLENFMDIINSHSDTSAADNDLSESASNRINDHLNNFSLITHKFGTPIVLSGLTTFMCYLQESLDLIAFHSNRLNARIFYESFEESKLLQKLKHPNGSV